MRRKVSHFYSPDCWPRDRPSAAAPPTWPQGSRRSPRAIGLLNWLTKNLRQRCSEAVDVFGSVKGPGADADRALRKRVNRPVNVRGAVQAGADGDFERLVENPAKFRGRQRLAAKAQRANAPGAIAVAENYDSRQLLQPLPQALDQVAFVVMDVVEPFFLDELNPGAHAGDAED